VSLSYKTFVYTLQCDLLITETTYATTVRESKRRRESDFLNKIKECLDNGGKVLVPVRFICFIYSKYMMKYLQVFALGRAQELFILVEQFWERFGLKHPIYFTTGLAEKATSYYKLFITWTSETLRDTFVQRNAFDFKYIKPFNHSYTDQPGPMLVFSTPGLCHVLE
jgi:integrator complex subunit 11